MFYSKINPAGLNTKRLDSDFYRPEYLEVEKKLNEHRTVPLGTIGGFFTGPFGSKLPSNLYKNEGIPLFRVGNVGQFEVITDNFAHLDPVVHQELQVSEVLPGDLLLVKASVGEKICKIPEWLPRANITQHIIAIRPTTERDTDYVSAFLFSKFGHQQLQRYSLGSIIQYLGVTDAKSVLLLELDAAAQKYIGEKVRQAERLRVWAKSIKQTLQEFENDIPVKKFPRTNKKYAISRTFDLTENRLDAEFYEDKHIDLSRQFNGEFFCLGALTTGFKYGSSVKADYVAKGKGIPFVRGNALTDNEISKSDIVYLDRSLTDELKNNFLNIGDVMITRSGTVGVACDVYEGFDKYAYGSFIINSKPKSEIINPLYLSWYLNSWVGQQQFRRWENGAVQLNINTEELASIEVWTAPNEFQLKVAEQIKLLRAVNRLAQCLIASAKLLVEDLIEGQLTESQLVSAQQALEAGDDSLDRALLERMTAEGIDGEGDPLFDDIEQLYDLLEQAKQALDADDTMAEA